MSVELPSYLRFATGLSLAVGLLCGCGETPVQQTRRCNAAMDLLALQQKVRFPKPLNCQDVIAYGLQHNIDQTVADLELSIREEARSGARLKMLPSLTVQAERSKRSHYDASISMGLDERKQSEEPSFSEGRNKRTLNANLTWSLIDFGISYNRARQAANQARISGERRRRARQNLVLQISEVYWKVQVAREAAREAADVLTGMTKHLEVIRRQLQSENLSRHDFIKAEAQLLENRLQLRRYEKAEKKGLAQLAALMGLPVGTLPPLIREDFKQTPGILPQDLPYRRLELEALCHRPEFVQQDLEEQNALHEARIAMLSLWPNANLFARRDYDANRFLRFHNWQTVGLEATMNLLSIPETLSKRRKALLQAELARKRRVGLLIGMIAQLRIAGLDYQDAGDEYGLAHQLSANRSAYLKILQDEKHAGEGPDLTEILIVQALAHRTRVQELEAFSRVKVSQIRIANTVGRSEDDLIKMLREQAQRAEVGLSRPCSEILLKP